MFDCLGVIVRECSTVESDGTVIISVDNFQSSSRVSLCIPGLWKKYIPLAFMVTLGNGRYMIVQDGSFSGEEGRML